jgi:glutamate dehydrogenase/leucine dehydrogenase
LLDLPLGGEGGGCNLQSKEMSRNELRLCRAYIGQISEYLGPHKISRADVYTDHQIMPDDGRVF